LLLLWLTLPAVVQAQFNYTTNNGTITIAEYTGPGGAVTIPSTINGLPVTSIGQEAFYQCTNMTSITIPDSVTSIETQAFEYSGLTSITIPNSVTSIGAYVFAPCCSLTNATIGNGVTRTGTGEFYDCTNLTSVTIPNTVTSIGHQSFHSCSSLTSITIPDSVKNIEGDAFDTCTSLTSVTIPDSVTNIDYAAFCRCTSLTNVTIPKNVTSIGTGAFGACTSLPAITVDTLNSVYSSVAGVLFNKSQTTLSEYPAGKPGSSYTIPGNVTNIADAAFSSCTGLTSVTIPNSVTSIGYGAFDSCSNLTSVTIGSSVTSIGDFAFYDCASLRIVQFNGNAPSFGPDGSSVFSGDNRATIYCLPGTSGWGATFGGRPIVRLQGIPPNIQMSPQTQTAEAWSTVNLWVETTGSVPLFCVWYLNSTNLLSCSTNRELALSSVQFSQSGAYTVVVSNALGAVTSAPAMLNVIAAVEHRPVPGVKVTSETGSLLNVDYANSLSPAPNWTTLGSVSLTGTSQYYFDLTLPLPPQRFYRAWQTGTPGVVPSLGLHMVPAITLTSNVGDSVGLDYINQFGPIDDWVTLDTVTLTNTSQLYFDISAPGQPQRLYRLAPSP
jgi:hypothetical protein